MPNLIYIDPETEIVYGSEVGDDVAWSSESIGDGAGRQSALGDLGAGPRASRHSLRIFCQAVATPTLAAINEMFLKTAGSETATPSNPDNDDGTGDLAVSSVNKLKNLHFVRSPIVDEAAANIEFVASCIVEILARHVAIVMWNEMGSATTADAAETKAILTPIPDEIQ